jgi:hypothetical protein
MSEKLLWDSHDILSYLVSHCHVGLQRRVLSDIRRQGYGCIKETYVLMSGFFPANVTDCPLQV